MNSLFNELHMIIIPDLAKIVLSYLVPEYLDELKRYFMVSSYFTQKRYRYGNSKLYTDNDCSYLAPRIHFSYLFVSQDLTILARLKNNDGHTSPIGSLVFCLICKYHISNEWLIHTYNKGHPVYYGIINTTLHGLQIGLDKKY